MLTSICIAFFIYITRNAVNSHINNLRPPCGLSGTDLESATSSNGTTTYEIVGSVDIGAAHAVKSPNGHAVSVATIPVTRVTRNAAAAIKGELMVRYCDTSLVCVFGR